MRKWRIEDSAELYNINGWGLKYFSINDKGHVAVTPREGSASVDLKELMDELQVRDVTSPVLLRFPDILDNRIEKISKCFQQAADEYGYTAKNFIIYPIKVNQMRQVVEEIVSHGKKFNIGLEAGSKPELHAVLAINTDENSLIICNGYKDENGAVIKSFRENIGSNFLAYCASYYPWINTSIVTEKDITFYNIEKDSLEKLEELILNEFSKKSGVTNEAVNELMDKFKLLLTMKEDEAERFHTLLYQVSSVYRSILREIRLRINLLPPSASMAGLYTMVDNTRGVWKAPANISINNVVTPALSITNAEQEDLNVPMNGKAVNAIRSFPGEGIKVWGARTMDGNSLDWRYINVRRTMIFLEESIKNAARAYVFEPNVANTWVNMRSMIDGFLRGVWKRGGLAGTSPEDAYSIHIGLGDTMTPEDILEGILRISVFVAITRPAEFIEITFQQQMQKS